MSSRQHGNGEDWTKALRKVTVQAGPLKGARYGDVSFDDLNRSYRADPRFNQYAKRMVSERALGNAPNPEQIGVEQNSARYRCCSWKRTLEWKTRGRVLLASVACLITLLILSRPLFYIVFARSLKVLVRVALRRSVGLLVLLIDSILDEAAASLEAGLLAAPTAPLEPSVTPAVFDQQTRFEIQQQHTVMSLLINGLFTLVGIILGRHWHGFPTRLHVAGAQRP